MRRTYHAALVLTAVYPTTIDMRAALRMALARAGRTADRWVQTFVAGTPSSYMFISSTGRARSQPALPADVDPSEVIRIDVPIASPASQAFLSSAASIGEVGFDYQPWLESIGNAQQVVSEYRDQLLADVKDLILSGELDAAEAYLEKRRRELSANGADAGFLLAILALTRFSNEAAERVKTAISAGLGCRDAFRASATAVGRACGNDPIEQSMQGHLDDGRRWIESALDADTSYIHGASLREACCWLYSAWALGEQLAPAVAEPAEKAANVAEELAVRATDALELWPLDAEAENERIEDARRSIAATASTPREARRIGRDLIESRMQFRRSQLEQLV